jgi:hypothetical protein
MRQYRTGKRLYLLGNISQFAYVADFTSPNFSMR